MKDGELFRKRRRFISISKLFAVLYERKRGVEGMGEGEGEEERIDTRLRC